MWFSASEEAGTRISGERREASTDGGVEDTRTGAGTGAGTGVTAFRALTCPATGFFGDGVLATAMGTGLAAAAERVGRFGVDGGAFLPLDVVAVAVAEGVG